MQTGPVDALVVTAPLQSSQPLVNPSAAATRVLRGVFVRAGRDEEKTTTLNLTDSSFEFETVLNSADFAASWSNRSTFTELNVSLQNGEKKTNSNVNSATFGESSASINNKINLVPVQAVLAYKATPSWSFGIKQLFNFAKYDSQDDMSLLRGAEFTKTSNDDRLKANFSFTSIGATYALGAGFFFGAGAEGVLLQTNRKTLGDYSLDDSGNITRNKIDNDEKRSNLVIKQNYGLGYLKKFSPSTLRLEVSYERMPPIDQGDHLSDGERVRGTIEALWSIFHFGVEVTTRKGYFVDANYLVPYFFKFEQYSDESIFDYRIFGGFRSAKGHGFGASFFKSTSEFKERLSVADPAFYDIQRKSLSFGLSYTYLF